MSKSTVEIEFTEIEAYILAGYLREALANNPDLIKSFGGNIKHALSHRKDLYSTLYKLENNDTIKDMIEQEKRLFS
jgi:hypothetical protein